MSPSSTDILVPLVERDFCFAILPRDPDVEAPLIVFVEPGIYSSMSLSSESSLLSEVQCLFSDDFWPDDPFNKACALRFCEML